MPNDKSGDSHPKRFRVAFSFAGEKRDFVEKVARILSERFSEDKILYDKFHEAEFARYDLGIRLPILYGEQSDLIVPVICPNYEEKRWTGWEWVHIYSLLTKADGHRVMPSRFEYAHADGLSPASGFIELDEKTPEQFATLILERLAINEGLLKDHYTKRKSSRKSAPKLRTDQNPFQISGALPYKHVTYIRRPCDDELERVLNGRDRLISITGEYGIGKSSLMQQARRILKDHIFFGGGLADLGGHDEARFMKNIFKLFADQFGPISDWDELDQHVKMHPSVLMLDDIGEVPAPGLDALVPALVDRLSRASGGLRAISTSPTSLKSVFLKRGLGNPKYSKPWQAIHVSTCGERDASHLFNLLPPSAHAVAMKHINTVARLSGFAPQPLQCLCHRLFNGTCDGLSEEELSAIVEQESTYE